MSSLDRLADDYNAMRRERDDLRDELKRTLQVLRWFFNQNKNCVPYQQWSSEMHTADYLLNNREQK